MVHVIPFSVGQRRLDAGNVVQYPQGSPIGGAMQGFGDQLSAVAERYQQMKAQQEAFDADLARRRFNGRVAQAEDEVAANAPADGAGLHDAMYSPQVDPRSGKVVKPSLFDMMFDEALPNIPQSQRAAFANQKDALYAAGARRMAQRQLQRRRDYEQAQVDTALQTSAIAIGNADPDDHVTFEAARQEGLDLIDKMGVDQGIRQQKAKDWFSTAAKARFEALIAKDPKRALEILGVGTPADGGETAGDTMQAAGGPVSGSFEAATAKGNRVGRSAADALAYLSQDDIKRLIDRAHAGTAAQLVEARTNIALASQNAPDAIANTGSYSGNMPSTADFAAVYGAEEGGKQYRDFAHQIGVGRQAFGMRIMPSQAVHDLLRNAESGPGSSQDEDQGDRDVLAEAARQNLSARTNDPGGYARHVFPNVDAAWDDVSKGYQSAVVLSVAAQQQLGIEDIQPLPNSVAEDTVMSLINKGSQREGAFNANRNLLGEIADPAMRLSLIRQLIYVSAIMATKH
jgi:hypothetical protein